jgi:hypothetical protein
LFCELQGFYLTLNGFGRSLREIMRVAPFPFFSILSNPLYPKTFTVLTIWSSVSIFILDIIWNCARCGDPSPPTQDSVNKLDKLTSTYLILSGGKWGKAAEKLGRVSFGTDGCKMSAKK